MRMSNIACISERYSNEDNYCDGNSDDNGDDDDKNENVKTSLL